MKDEKQFMYDMLQGKLYNVTINDTGLYKMTCERGHTTYTMLQNGKFEILFDMGIYAFQDGYYRESVANFAASLERFYEYSIRLFCFINGINESVVDLAWKNVAAQSERQFGAYCFLYVSLLAKTPDVISNSNIKFRNKVIHQGYIPTFEETLNYATSIYNFIMKEIVMYKRNYNNVCQEMVFRRLTRLKEKAQKDNFINVATCCLPTALSFTSSTDRIPSFEETIKKHIRLP
jgi:hypothetical protein